MLCSHDQFAAEDATKKTLELNDIEVMRNIVKYIKKRVYVSGDLKRKQGK